MFQDPLFYLVAGAIVLFLLFLRVLSGTVRFFEQRKKLNRPDEEFKQADLAQAMVEAAEKAREAVLWARSPDRSPAEGKDRPQGKQSEDVPVKARRNIIYAAISRIKSNQQVFQRLLRIQEQVKAEFGQQAALPLGVIINTRSKVIGATEKLLQLDLAVHGNMQKELERRRPLEVVSGLRIPDDGIDPIKQELDEALLPLKAIQKSLR
jgi:hypothetical protein